VSQAWQSFLSIARSVSLLTMSVLALDASIGGGRPVGAQEAQAPRQDHGQVAVLSYGERLYDNHWVVLKRLPPSQANPLCPGDARNATTTTWRCVSCHGWDYSDRLAHRIEGIDDFRIGEGIAFPPSRAGGARRDRRRSYLFYAQCVALNCQNLNLAIVHCKDSIKSILLAKKTKRMPTQKSRLL
jgi:hypothetical protein